MLQDLPIWLAHFRSQAAHPRLVPTALDDTLTGRERRLIGQSIATFQLGASSLGSHLREAVRLECGSQDEHACIEIFDLLIAEEQRHASLLDAFMQDHEIFRRERAITDQLFRTLRRLGGLRARLRILVTAEIIGIVYFRALEVVTDCRRLQILCRSIAADELAHVAFESQLLLQMRGGKRGIAGLLACAWEQFVLGAAALVVFATHRRVLKSAGYGAVLFVHDCRSQYAFYLKWPPALRRLSAHGT
jgi:hypothetical protein